MRRKAFTLVELLVVVGILVLLIGILMPSATAAHRNAIRTRMRADIAAIEFGLEAHIVPISRTSHVVPTQHAAGKEDCANRN